MMQKKHHFVPILVAALVAFHAITSAYGQEEQERPPVLVSVVAIGDPPQPTFSIREEKRHLDEVSNTEYPPQRLFVMEKKEYKELALGLNTPSETITYRGAGLVEFFKGTDESEKINYCKVQLPATQDNMTVFMVRNRKSNSWSADPDVKVVSNSNTAFPQDSVRFLNFSTVPIVIQIGKSKARQIRAGGSHVARLTRAQQGILEYRVGALVQDKVYPITDTAMTYTQDSRINLVTYNADGEDKRTPVKITKFFELPLRKPKPEAKP